MSYSMHRPLESSSFKGAVRWIIIVSGALLLLQQFTGHYLVPILGLVPAAILEKFWLWQVVTYAFLHGGVFHWLFNMLVVWMFGRELEVRWGTAEFVRFFFITSVGAALCVIAAGPHSAIPTIGSSGAVFGMLVAFAMLFPNATMYLYFVVPVKAWQAAALFGFIEIFAAMQGGGHAPFAHLGGMVVGFLYLRFSGQVLIPLKKFFRSLSAWFGRKRGDVREGSRVELHEVTDDLVKEVDRILEKILKQGVESLTPSEKKMMEKYSRLKR